MINPYAIAGVALVLLALSVGWYVEHTRLGAAQVAIQAGERRIADLNAEVDKANLATAECVGIGDKMRDTIQAQTESIDALSKAAHDAKARAARNDAAAVLLASQAAQQDAARRARKDAPPPDDMRAVLAQASRGCRRESLRRHRSHQPIDWRALAARHRRWGILPRKTPKEK